VILKILRNDREREINVVLGKKQWSVTKININNKIIF
jgi:hypothetical protein